MSNSIKAHCEFKKGINWMEITFVFQAAGLTTKFTLFKPDFELWDGFINFIIACGGSPEKYNVSLSTIMDFYSTNGEISMVIDTKTGDLVILTVHSNVEKCNK